MGPDDTALRVAAGAVVCGGSAGAVAGAVEFAIAPRPAVGGEVPSVGGPAGAAAAASACRMSVIDGCGWQGSATTR